MLRLGIEELNAYWKLFKALLSNVSVNAAGLSTDQKMLQIELSIAKALLDKSFLLSQGSVKSRDTWI